MSMPEVDVTIVARGTSAVCKLPFDSKDVFGRVRAPVKVTVNGHTFATTTMRYGGVDYVGFNKQVRAAAGIEPGDRLTILVELDGDERVVEVPDDLAAALAGHPDAKGLFDGLSYTHRREYVRWITDAKRPETRARRLERAVEMLAEGVRHP
jgi:bifunctional DNA-binding transcriptional regulator/antitoxin component of YhaV-PrlF toxin-antitoxin module